MASLIQKRGHSGHSHHHHHHDNAYLTSTNKNDAGVKITRVGLFVNLGMAISKGIGGWFFNSQVLIADALHALTDLVSDFMTLATVSLSLKPPTTRFPSGYGKVESLGSLGVSGILLVGGVFMGFHAIEALYFQFFLDAASAAEHMSHSHGHSHSHVDFGPNVNAVWLALGSIVVKEWLYRASKTNLRAQNIVKYVETHTRYYEVLTRIYVAIKIARERKSAVLASNAVHHRIDSLTSIVALLAIGGSHFLHNAAWLDPVGGLLVSAMVIQAGWANTGAALLELADAGVDEEVKNAVAKSAKKSLVADPATGIQGVSGGELVEVKSVQGIKAGQNYLMDVVLAVPGEWSIQKVQGVEKALREKVGSKVKGVRRVKVRFVPKDTSGNLDFTEEFIGTNRSPRISPEPEAEKECNHDHGRQKDH
jgi:cation diffusion facilitator family transporter